MKKRMFALLGALVSVLSCGTTTLQVSQSFDDGLYYTPRSAPAVSQAQMNELVAESLDEDLVVSTSAGDTLVVPKGNSVRLNLGSDVTVVNTYQPDLWWAGSFWSPWYYSSWDYWYRPYRYYSWRYYSPWYYDPWYYSSWYYDPWYYDSWYWRPYHHYYHHYYGGYYHHYGHWYAGYHHRHHYGRHYLDGPNRVDRPVGRDNRPSVRGERGYGSRNVSAVTRSASRNNLRPVSRSSSVVARSSGATRSVASGRSSLASGRSVSSAGRSVSGSARSSVSSGRSVSGASRSLSCTIRFLS